MKWLCCAFILSIAPKAYAQDADSLVNRVLGPDPPVFRAYLFLNNVFLSPRYDHQKAIIDQKVKRITYYVLSGRRKEKILEEQFDRRGLKVSESIYEEGRLIVANTYFYKEGKLNAIHSHGYELNTNYSMNKATAEFYLYPLARSPDLRLTLKNGLVKQVNDGQQRYEARYRFRL